MPEERREQVLRAFEQSRLALLSAIDELSEQQMSDPSLDGWSVKDNLAHIAHMDELRLSEIHRVSNGYQVAYRDDHPKRWEVNEMGVDYRRHLSLAQVLWELGFIRTQVLDAVKGASERGLDRSQYGEFGLDGGAEHEHEHAQTIRRWRQSKGT